MIVLSNATRTYKIEGVSFTPSKQGTKVPENKIKDIKDNFFFKTLCDDGVLSEKLQATSNKETKKDNKAK